MWLNSHKMPTFSCKKYTFPPIDNEYWYQKKKTWQKQQQVRRVYFACRNKANENLCWPSENNNNTKITFQLPPTFRVTHSSRVPVDTCTCLLGLWRGSQNGQKVRVTSVHFYGTARTLFTGEELETVLQNCLHFHHICTNYCGNIQMWIFEGWWNRISKQSNCRTIIYANTITFVWRYSWPPIINIK